MLIRSAFALVLATLWLWPASLHAQNEPMIETYRGVHLIVLPTRATNKYDVSLVGQKEALGKIRKAFDIVFVRSSLTIEKINVLKGSGDVIVVYDPDFPQFEYNKIILSGFSGKILDFLSIRFPNVFDAYSIENGRRIYLSVLGRHVIKRPIDRLAGSGIVHELAGHGIQHFENRLKGMRSLDKECEASLYELNFYQDLENDKFSRNMIQFRQALQRIHCDDFRRYMRERKPSLMHLWDELNVDVSRLLEIFQNYTNSHTT